jgi:hypothetical protein
MATDDGQPITDEWLREVGFQTTDCGSAGVVTTSGPMEGLALMRVTPTCTRWIYQQPRLWDAEEGGGSAFVPAPKTRGEVRALCRCLGIPLNE